jgi:hypothetical protein
MLRSQRVKQKTNVIIHKIAFLFCSKLGIFTALTLYYTDLHEIFFVDPISKHTFKKLTIISNYNYNLRKNMSPP